jgi:hypothetical protein
MASIGAYVQRRQGLKMHATLAPQAWWIIAD